MRVVNEEARSRGKRPDSKGSSEIEATRLPWRVRVGRRQESQQPEGGGLVTPGGTAKEARGVVSVVGNMARALRAVILPRKPSLGAQNQIKREVDAAL